MNVNTILKFIEFFIKRLEAAVVNHEEWAVTYIKQIEAAEIQKAKHFAEALRARNVAAKIRDLIS